MINVIDHYYDKVSNEKLSKAELLQVLKEFKSYNSFGSNNHTAFELYWKMSESPNADDDLIRTLVATNLESWGLEANETWKILDNGSKKLFNDLWKNGLDGTGNRPIKHWRSKHTSTKQLNEIYPDLTDRNRPDIDKNWLKQQRHAFFKHPNAPAGILARNTGDESNMVEMAKNPNITNKPAVFEKLCKKAKITMSYRIDSDGILEALLTNKHLDWKTVAKGIDLSNQLGKALNGFTSTKRKELLIEFCKHDDCPDELKGKMYELTQDEDFLPQTAKDVFLF